MGGNLLRRKILKKKILSFFLLIALLLIIPAAIISAQPSVQPSVHPSAPPEAESTEQPAAPLAASPVTASTAPLEAQSIASPATPPEEENKDLLLTLEKVFRENSDGEPRVFSRPLRTRLDPGADHPYRRGVLPSSYQTGGRDKYAGSPYSMSLLLSSSAMQNPLTQQYIRQYSSAGGLSWLVAVMERGSPYLAFIRKEIERLNMPEELLFLPVIESGYLSTAVSRSGAVGLWQFMKNSIGPFDMKVDDWMDERRDFWKSTLGALRKLEENYKYYGDWPLALAAYNMGLGGLNRVIQQSGIKDYWTLSEKKLLRTETIHYVPKLLATAHVLSNLRQYGIEPRWPEDPKWERMAIDRSVDLRLLEEAAGMNSGELLKANRELVYNVTPPGKGYYLKVPGKDSKNIALALSRNDLPLLQYYYHTIRSGDTLLALALHYGISVNQILAANPGVEERFLRIGNRLLIPTLKETAPYQRQGPSMENLTFGGTHLVKRGETLWSIALAYEVDPEVLAEANDMALNDILREGKILKTPIK